MNENYLIENNIYNPEIMCIDDNETQLMIYKNYLKSTGFNISLYSDPKEALDEMKKKIPDLILLDIHMPVMNGFEFINRLQSYYPGSRIPIIMISSYSSEENITAAFRTGAVDFIRKPFFKEEFVMRIKLQVQDIMLKKMNLLRFEDLEKNVKEKMEEIKDIKNATIFSLAKIAESRDPETGEHLERIREYVKVLAEELLKLKKYETAIDREFIYNIYHMSVLHDIGKVGIPDNILLKPGKLTPGEFEIMKTHTVIGGKALDKVTKLNSFSSFLEMARDIAYSHHECWDGSGYPIGLKEDKIPLAARITAVADVYDAISFKRVYRRNTLTDREIDKIMERGAGKIFDPEIYMIYISLKDKFKAIKKVFN